MTVLVTGAAGFIGFHTVRALLARGETVIGVDNLNPYYDPALKRARLSEITSPNGFTFREMDIADDGAMLALADEFPSIDRIVHLAAQPGVRYSLENPFAYVQSNVMGHVVVLELARRLKTLKHLVYASSSSVYGANETDRFAIEDRTDSPTSLYGATKRADELISFAYHNLFDMPVTGLRLFTVYGPWGRPDMAVYSFADAITKGERIRLFNDGEMWRDFTYVDDIVDGFLRALDRPPSEGPALYNLGNSRPVKVLELIEVLESTLGRKAVLDMVPMPRTEMLRTYADIDQSRKALGYDPQTTIQTGLPQFVDWYRRYHGS